MLRPSTIARAKGSNQVGHTLATLQSTNHVNLKSHKQYRFRLRFPLQQCRHLCPVHLRYLQHLVCSDRVCDIIFDWLSNLYIVCESDLAAPFIQQHVPRHRHVLMVILWRCPYSRIQGRNSIVISVSMCNRKDPKCLTVHSAVPMGFVLGVPAMRTID